MKVVRGSLVPCPGCSRFVSAGESSCPFCAQGLIVPGRGLRAPLVGFAFLSFFGLVAIPGCAYGAPPGCTNDDECGTGYVCEVAYGECVPGGSPTPSATPSTSPTPSASPASSGAH